MTNKEIFIDVINGAKNGKVVIDGDVFPICFNTIIEDRKIEGDSTFPYANIKDEENFLKNLDEYLDLELSLNRKHPLFIKEKEENLKRMLISYLFVNSSVTDFENVNDLLRKRINFLKDNTFKDYSKTINVPSLLNSNLVISNDLQSVMMECANALSFKLEKDGEVYSLPKVFYGIDNDTCYIYSIMNDKKFVNNDTPFKKKVNRLLYKLNENVFENESDEYKEYLQNKDYYPENISDVSVSFLLSLSMFIKMLKMKNINKVKVVPFLPVRYLSRSISSRNISDDERNDKIQDNATNKFIRTFQRCVYHIDGLEVLSYPYMESEYLELRINDIKEVNNDMLFETIKKIK